MTTRISQSPCSSIRIAALLETDSSDPKYAKNRRPNFSPFLDAKFFRRAFFLDRLVKKSCLKNIWRPPASKRKSCATKKIAPPPLGVLEGLESSEQQELKSRQGSGVPRSTAVALFCNVFLHAQNSTTASTQALSCGGWRWR